MVPAALLEESGPLLPSEGVPLMPPFPVGKAGAVPAVRGTKRRRSHLSPWEVAVGSPRGVVSSRLVELPPREREPSPGAVPASLAG